jgi:hypothetical protein
MVTRRRAAGWAVATGLAVFVAGSLLTVWDAYEFGPATVTAESGTTLWAAVARLPDNARGIPGGGFGWGLHRGNLRTLAGLLTAAGAAGCGLYLLAARRLRPDTPGDYGEGPNGSRTDGHAEPRGAPDACRSHG